MRAIGRPCGVRIVPIAIGELHRLPWPELAVGNINKEQVLPPLIDKADAIESIEKPIDHSCFGQRFPVLGLLIQRTNRRTKDQLLAIRRPGWMRGAMWHKGQLMSFASIGWHEPHLPLSL